MDVSSLYLGIAHPAGANAAHSVIAQAAPDWLHLVPAGVFYGRDGRGPYQVKNAEAVIAASMAEGKIALDENHATDFAQTTGVASPARGWFDRLETRADGIWGHVEWTESGATLMSDKAYRGVSPVFTHGKDGSVIRILRAALTNTPNIAQLATLHSAADAATHTVQSTGATMELSTVRQALGLPDTADEAACLAAMNTQRETVARQSEQIAGLGKTTVPVDQVIALQSEINTMKADAARDRATAVIDAAIAQGKPIVPVREQLIAQHMTDPTTVEALIGGLVSINATRGGDGKFKGSEGDGMEAMSETDMMVAKKMGLDPKAFAAHKAKMKAEASDGMKA